MKLVLQEETRLSEKTGKNYITYSIVDEDNNMEVCPLDFSNRQLYEGIRTYKRFMAAFNKGKEDK